MLNNQESAYDIIIVGAGPSGLIAATEAVSLATNNGLNLKIAILEKETKIARKLLASGNGRCNLGNQYVRVSDYETRNPQLLSNLLDSSPRGFPDDYWGQCGISIKSDEMGRLYPVSEEASAVHELIINRARLLGIEIFVDTEVKEIFSLPSGFRLRDKRDNLWTSKVLIISVGGQAAPNLGGSTSAKAFAKQLKLNYLDERPALTALVMEDKRFAKTASGSRFKGLAKLVSGQEFQGEFLFSNLGLSGIVAMDISNFMGINSGVFRTRPSDEIFEFYHKEELVLDFLPNFQKRQLAEFLLKTQSHLDSKDPLLIGASLIPHRILKAVINTRLSELNTKDYSGFSEREFKQELRHIAHLFKNYKLGIVGLRSFQSAQASRGGIDLLEIKSDLSVVGCEKIYCTGECLDVVGRCGGFNLHFAFLTGLLAGRNCVRHFTK